MICLVKLGIVVGDVVIDLIFLLLYKIGKLYVILS